MSRNKILSTFLTIGDPDLQSSLEIVKEMEKSGADMIMLNIPFSDPTAESPCIQSANERALKNGATTDKIFETVKEIKKYVKIPLCFVTYANIVFLYGIENFAKKSKECGISSIFIPDVPFEEKDEFAPYFEKYSIDFIHMIAPNSRERIQLNAKESKDFAFCINTGYTEDVKFVFENAKNANPNLKCLFNYDERNINELKNYSNGIILKEEIADIMNKDFNTDKLKSISDLIRNIKKELENQDK